MKKLLLLCAVLLGITALPVLSANQKDEDAAIQKRHDEWVAAWNSHDPKVMASFWLDNGDLIDPFGRHAQGRQAVEKLFEAEHTGTGVMVGTTYAGTIENIRYIGKNVAIVDVTAEISGLKGPDGAAIQTPCHLGCREERRQMDGLCRASLRRRAATRHRRRCARTSEITRRFISL